MNDFQSVPALARVVSAFMTLIAHGCGIPPHAFAVLTPEQRSDLELCGITPESVEVFYRGARELQAALQPETDTADIDRMIGEGGPVKPVDDDGRRPGDQDSNSPV